MSRCFWTQNQTPSSYSLIIPPLGTLESTNGIHVPNPPAIEGEDFVAMLETGKVMPMWNGAISQQFNTGLPMECNVIGQYQITFPYSNDGQLASVYRFGGTTLHGANCEIELVDIFTGKKLNWFLHETIPDSMSALTLADEFLDANIVPVFSKLFTGNIALVPRQFTLPSLLEGNTRYSYNANGRSYIFNVRLPSKSNFKLVPYDAVNLVRVDVETNTASLTGIPRKQTFVLEAEFKDESSIGGEHELKPILEQVRNDFAAALLDESYLASVKSVTVFSTFLDTFEA